VADGLVVTLLSGPDLELASTVQGAPGQHTTPHRAQGCNVPSSIAIWGYVKGAGM